MSTPQKGRVLLFSSFLAEILNYDPNTMTKGRLVYKISMLILCTSGFLMQAWQFMDIYFQYPSVSDQYFEYPDKIEMPAIVFCNSNGFKRREYCLHNENKCNMFPRGKEICKSDEELCRNKTYMTQYMVPSIQFLEKEMNEHSTLEDVLKYQHLAKDIFVSCKVSWAPELNICDPKKLGSYLSMGLFGITPSCYALNSRLFKEDTAANYIPVSSNEDHYIQVVLDTEPQEYFQPTRPVELMMGIHHPKKTVNCYAHCVPIFPGKAYTLSLVAKEVNLLPAPFQAQCFDYEAMDRANNGTEQSQFWCISRCVSNMTRVECGCEILPEALPLEWVNIKLPGCIRSADKDACINVVNPLKCFSDCAKDCRITNYEYTIREDSFDDAPENPGYEDKNFTYDMVEYDEEEMTNNFIFPDTIIKPYTNLFNKDRYIKITIRMQKKELAVFRQKPKFQTIEFFSYIGGYLGIWLGLSLIEVAALLELLMDQMRNRARKKSKKDQL